MKFLLIIGTLGLALLSGGAILTVRSRRHRLTV